MSIVSNNLALNFSGSADTVSTQSPSAEYILTNPYFPQTSSAISSFLVAMALFPDVQLKAQDELARVIGPTRLPEVGDLEKLPYVRALIMEVLRWMPVTPFGVPHYTTEEDEYNGYRIPKGTTVIPVGIVPVSAAVSSLIHVNCFLRMSGSCRRAHGLNTTCSLTVSFRLQGHVAQS